MAIEQDPCGILKESIADPEGGYIHKCGQFVIGKYVNLTVTGFGPQGAGTGEVIRTVQPCCPPCGIEPNAVGQIDFRSTSAFQENGIIEDL